MNQDVIYDGFSFNDNGIVLEVIDHMRLAARNNQFVPRANRNGSKLVQSQLGTKPIYISGYYIGSTPASAQLMYDTLAAALNRQERTLIVPHAGGTRRYTATPENLIISEPDGLNRLTFNFEFVVPDGHAFAPESTTLIDTTVTTASATIPLTVAGSVTARPLIILTFTGVTGGTAKTVSIRNARDFIGLTITRTFLPDDVISIDSENFQIYINGVLTPPDGRLPTWANGTGALFYSDSFTTREVDILASYTRKDL